MKNYFEYKGYRGTVEFSVEDNCCFGKIIGIPNLVSYESEDVLNLEKSFIEAVNDYLVLCEKYTDIQKRIDDIKAGKVVAYTSKEVLNHILE